MNISVLTNQYISQYIGKISEYRIRKAIMREIKERNKHIDEPLPVNVSLKSMCRQFEEEGHPNYFLQIKNRILRECQTDTTLFQYVLLHPNKLDDIHLTTQGLDIFYDILAGYFNDQDIKAQYEYMELVDKQQHTEWKLKKILTMLNDSQVLQLAQNGQYKANENYAFIIAEELKRRKIKKKGELNARNN